MKPIMCVYEEEVVRAVVGRRWPDSVDPDRQMELRQHVASCPNCSEVITLAAVFGAQREESLQDVHVPAAGQVWWRSAVRAHAEAAQAARRPMLWLQGIAGAIAVGVGAALLGFAWPSILETAVWVAAFGSDLELTLPDVAPLLETIQPAVPFALAVLACLVVTPIVVYFALSDD